MKRDPIADTIALLREEPRVPARVQWAIVLAVTVPTALFGGGVLLGAFHG